MTSETTKSRTMEGVSEELTRHVLAKVGEQGQNKQLWIAVAGAPGSGKTTLSKHVAVKLNKEGVQTTVVPMDGFHYYRRELDAMPDPVESHANRGAHWTFNAARLVEVLGGIRREGRGKVPSFDHAVGDPVEDAISVEKEDRIVIVEGNYLLLYDEKPWDELKSMFDEKWFVSCDESLLRERVIVRNSAAWGWDRARTEARVDSNDVPNARLVAKTSKFADKVIQSIEEPSWASS